MKCDPFEKGGGGENGIFVMALQLFGKKALLPAKKLALVKLPKVSSYGDSICFQTDFTTPSEIFELSEKLAGQRLKMYFRHDHRGSIAFESCGGPKGSGGCQRFRQTENRVCSAGIDPGAGGFSGVTIIWRTLYW